MLRRVATSEEEKVEGEQARRRASTLAWPNWLWARPSSERL